jgi:hypothetical protein
MTVRRALLLACLAASAWSCGPAAEISGSLATGTDADAGLSARDEPFDGGLRQRVYDGGPGASDCPNLSLESIRERVFLQKCGGGQCHSSDAPALGLDLSLAVDELSARLKEPSKQSLTGLPLIKAGAYGSSYLYLKVFLATPTEGDQMPPSAPLDQCTLDSLRDWIQIGAPDA